ncbi:hypothetical protein COV11_02555 [Candidatus Woesearchaeota archaeon CG10_big_fil_rev_8_21_14_0_10_30_7]|nr:MAG: hypothetical protein COV11_02555 [Candidatus Woesearchaeota archaeon CG10_big_fil_rev_8_21_14_0_10_30_7]
MIDLAKFTKELSNCLEGGIVLVETSASKILEVHLEAVKWLSKQKYTQIILSTTRPCKNLLELYQKNNIDTDKLIILCTCCKEKNNTKQEKNNIIHIKNNSSLLEITFSLGECIKLIKAKKTIFIDSINTLLIHNEPNSLAKFIHSVLTKMRLNNVSGLLISLDLKMDKEIRAEIAQLCDRVIRV